MHKHLLIALILTFTPLHAKADRSATAELPPGAQEKVDAWLEQVRVADEKRTKLQEAGVDPEALVAPEPPPFEIQPLPPRDEKPTPQQQVAIKWPASAVAPMNAEVISFLFDGYPISRMLFSSGNWLWALPVLTDFNIHPERGPASVRLENTLFPNTEIQFSFFADGSFLPDIEPASIEGYIRGLREQHGNAIRLPKETIVANTRVPVNGSIWWTVPYTLVDPEEQRPDQAVVDYIFKIEPYLVIVRHSGPERTVNAGAEMLQNALRRSYNLDDYPTELLE